MVGQLFLLNEDVQRTLKSNRYVSCAHCGCKNFIQEDGYSDLREIMKARKYKKIHTVQLLKLDKEGKLTLL